MLRYCGLCGYFERFKDEKSFGNCKAGHRASTNDTTFSTNTCDHFMHKRNFKDDKIIALYEKRASLQKYV